MREGRTTVYNKITSPELLANVNPENIKLEEDFLEYMESISRSPNTIKQYEYNLHIFWVWNLEHNSNKSFISITKREFAKFQNHCINEWGWSPRRVRTVKATLSSLSNVIESIFDDEYEDYRSAVRKIESPPDKTVREKTVFEMSDFQELLDKLVEKKEYMKACVLSLAINSGKRKAELTRFKASYFNDENLICGGALYKMPEKMVAKGRGANGKLIDVYVLAKPFKYFLNLWLEERERLGIESDWLFPKCVNGEWIDEHIEIAQMNAMANYFSKLSGKNFYFHACRHFQTSYLLDQNLPESVVQMFHSWESSEMVRVYDDRTNDSQLEKYFGEDGVKQIEKGSLENL